MGNNTNKKRKGNQPSQCEKNSGAVPSSKKKKKNKDKDKLSQKSGKDCNQSTVNADKKTVSNDQDKKKSNGLFAWFKGWLLGSKKGEKISKQTEQLNADNSSKNQSTESNGNHDAPHSLGLQVLTPSNQSGDESEKVESENRTTEEQEVKGNGSSMLSDEEMSKAAGDVQKHQANEGVSETVVEGEFKTQAGTKEEEAKSEDMAKSNADENETKDNDVRERLNIDAESYKLIMNKVSELLKKNPDDSFNPEEKSMAELLDYLLDKTMEACNSDVKQKIEKLTDEKNSAIENLNSEHDEFEKFKETNTKAKELLSAKNGELTQEIKDLTDKSIKITRDNDELTRKNKALAQKNEELEYAKVKLTKEKDALQVELDTIRNSNSGLLMGEIETLKENLNQKENYINALERSHIEALDAKQTEIESLESKVNKLEGDVNGKQVKIDELNGLVDNLNSTVSDKQNEIGELNGKIDNLNRTINGKQAKIDELDVTINKLNVTISDKQVKIDELNGKIQDLSNDVDAKQEQINTLNGKVIGLNETVAAKDREIGEWRQKHDIKAAEREAIDAECKKSIHNAAESVAQGVDGILKILAEGGYESGDITVLESCQEDEEANQEAFGKLADSIREIDTVSLKNAVEYYDKVKECIEKDLDKGSHSSILQLARLCAYARMPFMRENRGEDNYILDYRKLSVVESCLISLLGKVGITLIMPVPFCDKLNDGPFEHTPNSVPNLDYICPNVRQWIANLPLQNKDNVITDIVSVGYITPDGKTMNAKVLI